jgi:aspartate/methionine/tyrosine aminotransferase
VTQPPDDRDELLTEVRALRAEIADLRASQPSRARLRVRHKGRMQVVVTALETDPDVQYRVHRWGAIYWLINFPIFTYLFFFARGFWDTTGVFVILLYSLYANLATDYGAMSAAMAAKGVKPPPEIPLED